MTFDRVGRRVIDLYTAGRYDDALAVVADGFAEHPAEERTLVFWKACLLGMAGRPGEALRALVEGMERGSWWAPDLLADSDLDSVRTLPGWDDLLRRCREEAERFAASHRPEPQVRPAATERPAGCVVTLHGAGNRPDRFADRWRAATPEAWTVVAPAGSVPFTETERAWPADFSTAARAALAQIQPLDIPEPMVLAGYSQGSAVAALLAWDAWVAAAGLVLIAPSVRRPTWDPGAHRGVPAYLVIGEHDWALPGILELTRALEDHQVPVHLDVRPGIGHQTPDDLDAIVATALDWITAKS